ncbi:MAG: putative porin, partial [Gammaproteobacteria bacterium]
MKQTKLKWSSLALGAVASAACVTTGQAQSVDALLDKLVDKGVLTTKEAQELRAEADKDFTRAYASKSGMPEWVTALKLNGDVRLRFEGIHSFDNVSPDRNRFRYRVRPGITATLLDNFEVGVRLTSSEPSGSFGGDPVSGNTSFSDGGSKKFVYLDLVYAKWQAVNNKQWSAVFTGGKMENPLLFPGTHQFDRDYTPEGFGQEITHRINDFHSVKLTGLEAMLDEVDNSGKDPALIAGQLRWNAKWDENQVLSSTLGCAFMSILNREGLATLNVPNQGRGNTRDAAGNLAYGFNAWVADAGITYTFDKAALYNGRLPVTISGDYLYNPSAPNDNLAWSAGLTVGKAGKRKTWQLDYRYTHLEADAWYEEFVESDFGAYYVTAPPGGNTSYRSGTNVEGFWFKFSVSPSDSVTLSV